MMASLGVLYKNAILLIEEIEEISTSNKFDTICLESLVDPRHVTGIEIYIHTMS
jgi:hypothetical protein